MNLNELLNLMHERSFGVWHGANESICRIIESLISEGVLSANWFNENSFLFEVEADIFYGKKTYRVGIIDNKGGFSYCIEIIPKMFNGFTVVLPDPASVILKHNKNSLI